MATLIVLLILLSFQDKLVHCSDRSQWEILNIMLITPERFLNVPHNLLDGLNSAMMQIKSIVQVRHFEGNDFIATETITRCNPLWKKNETLFALIISSDTYISMKTIQIQQGLKLTEYGATFALFLEGFGLITPKGDTPMIKERSFFWRYARNGQIVTTHYMDFQNKALQFARIHFGCDQLEGIEAEDEKKTHLSEYIYGNELMTPVLANGKNFFTRISASILESTMLGNISWYKTNSSYVDAETLAYWYGYKWGCEFVQESCFSYIATMSGHRKGLAFPFCGQENLLTTVRSLLLRQPHPSYDVCLSNGTSEKRISVHCNLLTKVRFKKSPIGLTALPLTHQFGRLQFPWMKFYGSEDVNRYCPFLLEVINDRMPDLPENAVVVDCSTMKMKSENYLPTTIVNNNYFWRPNSIF